MILVDTSVWIEHFRRGNSRLRQLLEDGQAATHAFVIGELSCGSLPHRMQTLALMANLPKVPVLPDHFVSTLIERRKLWGKGIGWTDAHLLAAALEARVPLWTLDRRLGQIDAMFN